LRRLEVSSTPRRKAEGAEGAEGAEEAEEAEEGDERIIFLVLLVSLVPFYSHASLIYCESRFAAC
jgi:hypothetical protein